MGKKVGNLKIDPTLNWKLVQITEVLDNKIVFKDFKNEFGGQILKDQFKWAIKKKFKIDLKLEM